MTVSSGLRTAIEPVVASRAFRRADQLKRLLVHLAVQGDAGRAAQVTEYELGVEALGRPASFTPETDSSVRTRVHALRQKLEEYYRDEGAGDRVRVELPKGSYALELVTLVEEPAPVQTRASRRNWLWVALCSVTVLAAVAYWLRPASAVVDLWQPMLEAKAPVAILVGQPVHLWVRDMGAHPDSLLYAPFPDPLPSSDRFRQWIGGRLPNPGRLVLHPSPNAVLWGDAAGAAAAGRFLAFRQRSSELLPESSLKGEIALRGRAVIAFGRPEFSPAVARYLALAGGYTVGMVDALREFAIHRPGAEAYRNTTPPNEVNYGLVTVLEDGAARVFVFSGVTSDGSMAGLDYFTSEEAITSLREKLRAQGHAAWPRVFQVVVRTVSSAGYSMGAAYETHAVLKR